MKILVTGASGFLGRHLVKRLAHGGHEVTGLTRSEAGRARLAELDVTPLLGDVTRRDDLAAAVEAADCVVHAAADTTGSEEEGDRVTVGGTRLVAELCAASPGTRLIYISSCSVYDVAGVKSGSTLTEDAALEPDPAARGAYSRCKHEAEAVVREIFSGASDAPVIMRPGIIYGQDAQVFSPSLGFSFRNRLFAVIGPARAHLPMVHVDTVAGAAARLLMHPELNGPFNVIDPSPVSKRQYMEGWVKPRFPGAPVIYLPYFAIRSAVTVQEGLFGLLRRRPLLSSYRLRSSQNPVTISGQRLYDALDWTPTRNFELFCRAAAPQER